MNEPTAMERFGGWQTVRGTLLTATLVAVPVAAPLAAVLGRWAPAAEEPLAVLAVGAGAWIALVTWLLHGVRSLIRREAAAGLYGAPPVPVRSEAAGARAAVVVPLPVGGARRGAVGVGGVA